MIAVGTVRSKGGSKFAVGVGENGSLTITDVLAVGAAMPLKRLPLKTGPPSSQIMTARMRQRPGQTLPHMMNLRSILQMAERSTEMSRR